MADMKQIDLSVLLHPRSLAVLHSRRGKRWGLTRMDTFADLLADGAHLLLCASSARATFEF